MIIAQGWRPGLFGRFITLHGIHYARLHGFGPDFEAIVAAGLADFGKRLGNPRSSLWAAMEGETVLGGIAIDAEDMAPAAHLRWFILNPSAQRTGTGHALLEAALGHVDRAGFPETRLWTFAGLDAARRLYERAGFRLAEEKPGNQWGREVMEQLFIRPRPAAR